MAKVSIEIDRSNIASLLCSAMEGGIGYWGQLVEYVEPPEGADLFAGLDDSWQGEVFKHIHYPMCEAGGGFWLEDYTGEGFPGEPRVLVTWEALVRGLQVMAEKCPRHFADFQNENSDATTGDVFLQCTVFGEVVFG
jgi:hypothetical protein